MGHTVNLTVNQRPVSAEVEPRTHLADFLRERLLLTGTHLGCEHGVCGACTVLLDGQPARACITYAVACDGLAIHTVEGLQDHPVVRDLRAAFAEHHALQCGYCTPGMLTTALDIVSRLPQADERRVREELSGNLCRCTGYVGIVAAIRQVQARYPQGYPMGLAAENSAQPAAAPSPLAALPKAAPATPPPGAASAGASSDDADVLRREVIIDAAGDRVWSVLRDPATVCRCLPGAELGDPAPGPDRPLPFRFTVGLGPIKAAFDGSATVSYDDARRQGRLRGRGSDSGSRSAAAGQADFRLDALAEDRTRLTVELRYQLTGRLAQFSRGGLVDGVVDQLLARFAANLAAAATGRRGSASPPRPLGAFGLLLAALKARARRWRRRAS